MPKKLGENTKAVEARERKKALKLAEQVRATKEAEDKLWQDNDKLLAKKKLRKDEEEKKKIDQAKKKAEARMLLEQEMASINNSKQSAQKVTRQQIQLEVEKRNKNVEGVQNIKLPPKVVKQDLMHENLNRLLADTVVATNVDEAIAALSVNDNVEEDRHPEKRMRAAFKVYEAENLPRIKSENPTLRMSQWKQILVKEWNKSPQNPMNNN